MVNQILFSFSSEKDRRIERPIRRKKHSAAPPGIEPDLAVSSSIFVGAEREEN